MTLPPAALSGTPQRSRLALTSLLLSLVFPLGLLLFILRYVVESHPALQSLRVPALNLILHGVTDVVLVLGIPAFSVAIGLGHIALDQTRNAPSAQGARRIARVGLVLGYLSLLTVLGGVGLTVFWLSTHSMHLVW